MNVNVHLVVSSRGSSRLTKNKPRLDANEIAIQVNLDIPRALFTRPYPVVNLAIPDSAVDNATLEQAISMTADQVAERLHLDVEAVHDGLKEAAQKQQEAQNGD